VISNMDEDPVAWDEIIDTLIQLSIDKKNPPPIKISNPNKERPQEIKVDSPSLSTPALDHISNIMPSSTVTKYSEPAFNFETPGAGFNLTPADSPELTEKQSLSPKKKL